MPESWASSEAVRRSMQGNRSRDTVPELQLFLAVRDVFPRRRWQRNPLTVYGRPDVSIRPLRLAFFMDGCFWHGCRRHWVAPEIHRDYWMAKVAANRRRARRVNRALRASGWTVVRVWEHEAADYPRLMRLLLRHRRAWERREVAALRARAGLPIGAPA